MEKIAVVTPLFVGRHLFPFSRRPSAEFHPCHQPLHNDLHGLVQCLSSFQIKLLLNMSSVVVLTGIEEEHYGNIPIY